MTHDEHYDLEEDVEAAVAAIHDRDLRMRALFDALREDESEAFMRYAAARLGYHIS